MRISSCLVFLLTVLFCTQGYCEPYQLDPGQPAASALVLFDDPENEGVKLGVDEGVLAGVARRFFIKGYTEYQPVDIFVFSKTEGVELEMGLLLATWEDRQQDCKTGTEGYCQLKFRSYDGVGFDVAGPAGAEFTVIVVIGAEVPPVFDSPFYLISEADLDNLPDASSAEQSPVTEAAEEDSGDGLLYIIIGLLVVISALLALMVLRNSRGAKTTLLLLISAAIFFSPDGMTAEPEADEGETAEERMDRLAEEAIDEFRAEVSAEYARFRTALDGLGHVETAMNKIEELRALKASYDSFSSAYEGLGRCIASAPRFPAARIPSFCDYDYGLHASGVRGSATSCARCFEDSRTVFNQTRSTLARLETIYNCTKKMTTSAMAFGDSFSAATKSGLGWASARKGIEASETKLEEAYDNKYNELISRLHGSMIDMAICEAEYGLEDWYDRFGFVYYEFMADKYRRSK